MISDIGIFRSAAVLAKCHGQDAPIEAALRERIVGRVIGLYQYPGYGNG